MHTTDVQAYVEEPEICIITLSSSSIQDQTALITDRIKDLSTPVYTATGVPLTDILKFFYGDKPAAQFERGAQVGGRYPHGSCACSTHITFC